MIYLLDSDTLIFMIRGLKKGRSAQHERALKLVARCRQTQKDGHVVGVSAITVSELEYGARNSSDYEAEIAAIQKILLPFDICDYDAVACPPHYGRIRFDLERKGETIGANDLLIAAPALGMDATLVTNNLGHFRRVSGLRMENWS